MTVFAPAAAAASVSRALWGEVSGNLRCVRFRAAEHQIDLCFYFDGSPNDADLDWIGAVGAEVAADFPGATVAEQAIATAVGDEVECQEDWHTAYARKAASLTQ